MSTPTFRTFPGQNPTIRCLFKYKKNFRTSPGHLVFPGGRTPCVLVHNSRTKSFPDICRYKVNYMNRLFNTKFWKNKIFGKTQKTLILGHFGPTLTIFREIIFLLPNWALYTDVNCPRDHDQKRKLFRTNSFVLAHSLAKTIFPGHFLLLV